MKARFLSCVCIAFGLIGCQTSPPSGIKTHRGESFGSIEVFDPKLNTLIAPGTCIEKLASGFEFSEGPVWIKRSGHLLFSDVPADTVYRWSEKEGISIFLKPSGYSGRASRGGEPGSNGLAADSEDRLVLCEHGDRRIGRIEKNGKHATVADRFSGKRFNSPNDLAFKSNGDLYFTDPPYGLEKSLDDPKKELGFQGVYRVKPDGEVTLLTDQIKWPNGIAFSPDEKTLYVGNSDPKHSVWMAYNVKSDGTIANGRVFFDATSLVGDANKGVPDGMKVDARGNVWATGPGGVLVFSPDGKHLGTIRTGEETGNCAWGEDGSTLYIMAAKYIGRVRTKVKGSGW